MKRTREDRRALCDELLRFSTKRVVQTKISIKICSQKKQENHSFGASKTLRQKETIKEQGK